MGSGFRRNDGIWRDRSDASDAFHAFFVNLSDTKDLSVEFTLREAPAP